MVRPRREDGVERRIGKATAGEAAGVEVVRTMDIVLEDCGLVDGREVAAAVESARLGSKEDGDMERRRTPQGLPKPWTAEAKGNLGTNPLVKTFSKDVLPHAPSPLCIESISQSPQVAAKRHLKGKGRGERGAGLTGGRACVGPSWILHTGAFWVRLIGL